MEDCSSPAFYACVTEIQAAGVRGATALLGRFEVAAPDTVRVTFDSASLALGGAPGEVRPLRSGPAVVEQRIVCMAPGLHVTRSAAGTAVLRRVR